MERLRRIPRIILLLFSLLAASAVAAAEPEIDSIMWDDPALELGTVHVFATGLKALWLEALAQPEGELKRQAADAIARAHGLGMPHLAEAVPLLTAALDDGDRVVRRAAARALVALDAREAAPRLARDAVDADLAFAQIVEPALARWDAGAIREIWLERLTRDGIHRGRRLLAIDALRIVREPRAIGPLERLVLADRAGPEIRLAAARALSEIASDGLLDLARRLAADKAPGRVTERLAAARLLANHRGPDVEELLLELAADAEPAVAETALEQLLAQRPGRILAIVDRCLSSPSGGVRRGGAAALVAVAVAPADAIEKLSPLLDDPHPDVRRFVRRGLAELGAQPRFQAGVREAALALLATERWRGLEQAALLAAALDEKSAAGRLVELLDFPRPEVSVAAAWALRRLAVEATLPAALEKAHRETAASVFPEATRDGVLTQLFQLFGQQQYGAADPLLRQYVARDARWGLRSRAAAIWALGRLHADRAEPELAAGLRERLADVSSEPPESRVVRRMAAVALGRMQDRDALVLLERFRRSESTGTEVGLACGWAIARITGEEFPTRGTQAVRESGWFLEPLE